MKEPGGTATHPVLPVPVLPEPSPKPSLHCLHEVVPDTFWNHPSGHASHPVSELLAPILIPYCPWLHCVHSAALRTPIADEYLPSSQFRHSVTSFNDNLLLHFPATHPLQPGRPVSSWYCPFPQSAHTSLCENASAMYLPSLHLSHDGFPF